MTQTLLAAASGNLNAFAGAHIVGTIPLREAFLNDAIRQAISNTPGRIQQVEIRIGANNLIECGVRIKAGPFAKWFRPQLILSPRIITEQGPVIVLTVASSEYVGLMSIAQIFGKEFFPRGFRIDGRQVVIHLAAIPQMTPMQIWLPYIKQLNARTSAGRLEIDFELKVNE